MTDKEWMTCEETHDMLQCVLNEHAANRRKVGRRKLRLFACASCRLFCDEMTDPRSLAAIEYMERFTDGEADVAKMADVQDAAHAALRNIDSRPPPNGIKRTEMSGMLAAEAAFWLVDKRANWCVYAALKTSAGLSDNSRHHFNADRDQKWAEQLRTMCHLLREIFGNPFHSVVFKKSWWTDTVLSLARQMYDSREFSAIAILADALQDAGCDNDDILTHCRDANQVHIRGCWVLDLILGKT
jgi:hypothetical protein